MTRKSVSFADRSGPWVGLHDSIYHQRTTYGATYACLPYLVALADEVGTRGREELCLTFGFIAAGFACYGEPVPDDLAVAFLAALRAAADTSVRLLANESLTRKTAHYLAFGALALVGHPAGRLVDANLSPGAPPEVECECTSCSKSYLVALFPDGIARYSSDPPPAKHRRWRTVNWAAVETAGIALAAERVG